MYLYIFIQRCNRHTLNSARGARLISSLAPRKLSLRSFCVYFVLFYTVQHECIPQAILGMDILCQAKSGMGKTAVFVLATLQQIEPVDGQVGARV